jgi:hypothetical protein
MEGAELCATNNYSTGQRPTWHALYGEVSEHAVELRLGSRMEIAKRTAPPRCSPRDPLDIELHCTPLGRARPSAVYYGEVTRLTGRATGRREASGRMRSRCGPDTDCVKLASR